MTGTTSFLNLTTYSTTTDASAPFLDFRTDIAGSVASSNMQLIDDFAYIINGSVVDLMAEQEIIYPVTGSYASPTNYGATVASIAAYTTNQMLSLKLDTENDGEVNLRINALDVKSLRKVDPNGDLAVIQSKDLKKNREYLFRYDGTYFVLVGTTLADQLSILGTPNNLSMISGCRVLIDSGVKVSSGSRISGSYVEFLAINKISASYISAQGTDDNLLRHFGGSAINSGIVVSSGSRISGSYVAAQGTDDNLLRHFGGSAINSGIVVSSGSRISGSYVKTGSTLAIVSGSISLSETGISSGSYNKVEVNTYGQVITGSIIGALATISGSGVMSDTTGSVVKHNVSTVTAGSFTNANIEVDALGHIMSAVTGASGGELLDWSYTSDGTNQRDTTSTTYVTVGGCSDTLSLASAGVIFVICWGVFRSSGAWSAIVGANIDGSVGQYVETDVAAAQKPFSVAFAASAAAGNRTIALQQKTGNAADTCTVWYGSMIAFALAT